MRATRIITAVLAALVIAAILARPAGAVPTEHGHRRLDVEQRAACRAPRRDRHRGIRV